VSDPGVGAKISFLRGAALLTGPPPLNPVLVSWGRRRPVAVGRNEAM